MKRLLIILCVALFGYIQVGYYVHTVCLRYEARKEFKKSMFASIPDSSLQLFSLDEIEKNMQWEEDGKEFYLEDELYDIVKQATINGKTFIYCLNDRKEEEIIAQQMKITKNNANNSAGKNVKTTHFSLPDFLITQSAEHFSAALFRQKLFSKYRVYLTTGSIKIISPPPRLNFA